MALKDRYASAVNSSDLALTPSIPGRATGPSAPETLGAYALADRTLTRGRDNAGTRVRPAPLAVPLARVLEGGDDSVLPGLVLLMGDLLHTQSYRMNVRIDLGQCRDMARATLGWMRQPRCERCGGQKNELVEGTPYLSATACLACKGTGERPFVEEFKARWRPLAQWIREEVERSLGRAAAQASRHLEER